MPQPDQGPQTLTAPPGSPHGPTQQLPAVQPPPPPPPPPAAAPRAPRAPRRMTMPTLPRGDALAALLGLLGVAAVVLGLSLTEDGRTMWDDVHAWGALAIVGALLALVPALGPVLRLGEQRAWRAGLAGAGLLLLFWVLLVAPAAGSNVTLLVTAGVGAGLAAVWLADPSRRHSAGS